MAGGMRLSAGARLDAEKYMRDYMMPAGLSATRDDPTERLRVRGATFF